MDILVTNNPRAMEQLNAKFSVEYIDAPLLSVLVRVRDFVHKGHTLLSHPLSGSVKPNETLYKSVLVSGKSGELDLQSVLIIGECILKAQSFESREIADEYRDDMQVVDLSLIESSV